MPITWNSKNVQKWWIDDQLREDDGIEVTIHRGHEHMSIECTEREAQAYVFVDKAGAIELRDALNHFIQGTRAKEDRV